MGWAKYTEDINDELDERWNVRRTIRENDDWINRMFPERRRESARPKPADPAPIRRMEPKPEAAVSVEESRKELNEQELFIASAYRILQDMQESRKASALESPITLGCVRALQQYYENFFEFKKINAAQVLKNAPVDYRQRSGEYMFNGFLDSTFPQVEAGLMQKPDVRDYISDISRIMSLCGIENPGKKKKYDFFFEYVKEKYGLKQSQFFCCDECSAPLIEGIPYCPHCLKNTRKS